MVNLKNKKIYKKIPIVIASLLIVGCGIQIIRFKILLKTMKLLNIIYVTRKCILIIKIYMGFFYFENTSLSV
jgi:hypothetical protein